MFQFDFKVIKSNTHGHFDPKRQVQQLENVKKFAQTVAGL